MATITAVECSGENRCGTVTRVPKLVLVDNILVDLLGSSNANTGGNEQVVATTTAHRSCLEGTYPLPDGRFAKTSCFDDDAVNDAGADTQLPFEEAGGRFHRVRVQGLPNPQSSMPVLNYISTEPRATYRWDHALDFTNWGASTWGGSWIDDPYDQIPTARTRQSGRYRRHANTKAGQKEGSESETAANASRASRDG